MTPEDLQLGINELFKLPTSPASAWVDKVSAAPVEVVAGAIVLCVGHVGMAAGIPDPRAPRREAAQAILRARLTKQAVEATLKLHNTIDVYQQVAGRQATWILRLTWVIAALTFVLAIGVVDQLWSGLIADLRTGDWWTHLRR